MEQKLCENSCFSGKGTTSKGSPKFLRLLLHLRLNQNFESFLPKWIFHGFSHRILCDTPKKSRGSSTLKPFKFAYKMLYRGVYKRFSFNIYLLLVSANSDGEDDSDSDSEMETDPLQVGVSTVCSWKRAPIAVNLLNWSLFDLTSTSRCPSIFCKYLPALPQLQVTMRCWLASFRWYLRLGSWGHNRNFISELQKWFELALLLTRSLTILGTASIRTDSLCPASQWKCWKLNLISVVQF